VYAIVENQKVVSSGTLTELFPSISFPATGPDQEFCKENNLTAVEMTAKYNKDTEELVFLDTPKVTKGGKVVGVEVKKLSDEDAWTRIKTKRDQLLTSTDWTQLPDTLDAAKTKAYAEYRAALRDITSAKSPADVAWPKDPNEGK
jgi:hypothetical protein